MRWTLRGFFLKVFRPVPPVSGSSQKTSESVPTPPVITYSGNYASVDAKEAFKYNWDTIQSLRLPRSLPAPLAQTDSPQE
jgi:hypothetical protein